MHTQHVKFSAYVAGGCGVGGVVAVGVVFEEGEMSGLVEDDDRSSVLEVVVVVVFFLPSPSLLLVACLVDFIDTIVTGCSFFEGSLYKKTTLTILIDLYLRGGLCGTIKNEGLIKILKYYTPGTVLVSNQFHVRNKHEPCHERTTNQ